MSQERVYDKINYQTNFTAPTTFAILLNAIDIRGTVNSDEARATIFPQARAAIMNYNPSNRDTHGEITLKQYGLIEYVGDKEFKLSFLGKRYLELFYKNNENKFVPKENNESNYNSVMIDSLLAWEDRTGAKLVSPGFLLIKLLSDKEIDNYITAYDWAYVCEHSSFKDDADYTKLVKDILQFRESGATIELKKTDVFLGGFSGKWNIFNKSADGKYTLNELSKRNIKEKLKEYALFTNKHDDVFSDEEELALSNEIDDTYSIEELGAILTEMYNGAGNKTTAIHMFGFKYGEVIDKNSYAANKIISASEVPESYHVEINKGTAMYRSVKENEYGVHFADEIDVFRTDEIIQKSLPVLDKRTRKVFELNSILYGAPGTGKTYATAKYALAITEGKTLEEYKDVAREDIMSRYNQLAKDGQVVFTTFHQNYGYEDFIQGIRPDTSTQEMKFKTVDGVFKKIAQTAMDIPEKDFVIIIDEINRANISKVFGELITLIEDDKRWGEENAVSVTLPSGEIFAVPNNLYIVGTMNSADKSISLIDTALRRRFDFVEFVPDLTLISDAKLKAVLKKLNEGIEKELNSTDLLVGHSYFINKNVDDICNIMNRNIIPLLYEYFFDNKNKVEAQLKSALEGLDIEIISNTMGRIKIKKKEV